MGTPRRTDKLACRPRPASGLRLSARQCQSSFLRHPKTMVCGLAGSKNWRKNEVREACKWMRRGERPRGGSERARQSWFLPSRTHCFGAESCGWLLPNASPCTAMEGKAAGCALWRDFRRFGIPSHFLHGRAFVAALGVLLLASIVAAEERSIFSCRNCRTESVKTIEGRKRYNSNRVSAVSGNEEERSDTISTRRIVFSEGFEGNPLPGWDYIARSKPSGVSIVFPGDVRTFPAQAGAPGSYAAMNYNSARGRATISTWLISPLISMGRGSTVSFWTRTTTIVRHADRLQVCEISPPSFFSFFFYPGSTVAKWQ